MGDSAKLAGSGPDRYSFAEHRGYLDALLAHLGVESDVTLVVHDWGSALGFDWANRHRVAGACCVPTLPGVSEQDIAGTLVRRWWSTVWGDGDVGAVDQLLTDPFIRHTSAGTFRTTLKEYKQLLVEFQRVLHNARTVIDDEAVAGDRIWVRATSHGANLETGGPALVTWMVCFRVEGDRLAEMWMAVVPEVDWETR